MHDAFHGWKPGAPTVDAALPDALAYLPEATLLADEQMRVTYLNPSAEKLLGLSMKNACGHELNKVLILQDRKSGKSISLNGFSSLNPSFRGEFHLLACSGGRLTPVHYSIAPICNGTGLMQGYIVFLRDASELQHYIDKLVEQTMHDEHTRLLRRAELVKRLWRLLQESPADGDSHAFMYLDLDNFKALNDHAGHAAGDLAIRQIASRFKAVVRDRDTLARLGGDEFGLLLERCPAELARERAEQLHRAVESYTLRWEGGTYQLGVSIGLAIFRTHTHSLNTILAAADAACYQAKRATTHGASIREVELD